PPDQAATNSRILFPLDLRARRPERGGGAPSSSAQIHPLLPQLRLSATTSGSVDAAQCLGEPWRHSIYNLVDRLLRLLLALPVSTASAERAFSTLKIIKTRLRNTMEGDYLPIAC
uniref:HAT C-terminal dimerisation domain-containing protein n=1 Tax=Aegilops tauschii subsp. strangulata TaxID=200361 RepID=A0A453QX27_AEGTS